MIDTVYVVVDGLREIGSKISMSIAGIGTAIGVFTFFRIVCCS